MSAVDCVNRGVRNYPGGRLTVIARLFPGKSDDTVRKELSGVPSHKLGLVDAVAMAAMCCELQTPHCYDLAVYVAQECGGRFEVGPASQEPAPALNPMSKVSSLMRETSHVTEAVIEALQDGVISDNELAQIETEIAEAEEVLRKLRQAARAVNAAGKPRAERDMVTLPVRAMRSEVPA